MQYVTDTVRVATGARPFAANRLTVIVPARNPAQITRLQDLGRSGVKIVVAADAVPVGRYTRDVLARLAAAPEFGPDFRDHVERNVVSREENVSAVVAKVRLGEADAGFVYQSDIIGAGSDLTVIGIPDEFNVMATYPVATLTAARNAQDAAAFVAFLVSADGQQILQRFGFSPLTRAASDGR
jgi:molybdate transport system substrate-binding protein